jgi:dihydrofolate reductase
MIGAHPIEGYAIVSADDMIADATGIMPQTIRNDADQRLFQAELDRAAVLVHGRHSHEGGPRASRRKRLILTRHIATTAPDPSYPNAMLWNPAGVSIEKALAALGAGEGSIAIIGGTEVFGLFLPRYDAFHLTRAANATISGGRPLFPAVTPQLTVEDLLAGNGLRPGPRRELDPAAGITLTTWERRHG